MENCKPKPFIFVYIREKQKNKKWKVQIDRAWIDCYSQIGANEVGQPYRENYEANSFSNERKKKPFTWTQEKFSKQLTQIRCFSSSSKSKTRHAWLDLILEAIRRALKLFQILFALRNRFQFHIYFNFFFTLFHCRKFSVFK